MSTVLTSKLLAPPRSDGLQKLAERFGVLGLYEYAPSDFWTVPGVLAGLLVLGASMWLAARNATPPAMEQTCPAERIGEP